MRKTIKWGILGTSYISEVMADAIKASQTSELVAVGSRSITSANHFANKFSLSRPYDDYEKLLNDNNIDAIYIGLPNHLHKEWMIRCAKAKKNILCEKPFVVSITEAHETISSIEKENVFCMEALMYRHHPFTQKLQEIIQSEILGDIKLYHAFYAAPIADVANPTAGGSIRNLGCYPISLVRLLANAEPIDIRGTGRINLKNGTDNQASVILTFPDNVMAVVSTADDMEMSWQFEIYGTKGHLKIITNPWLPCNQNRLLITLHHQKMPVEINVTAEKPLYTYQIDYTNMQILQREKRGYTDASLTDSLGNTIVLETWLQQVKMLQPHRL